MGHACPTSLIPRGIMQTDDAVPRVLLGKRLHRGLCVVAWRHPVSAVTCDLVVSLAYVGQVDALKTNKVIEGFMSAGLMIGTVDGFQVRGAGLRAVEILWSA